MHPSWKVKLPLEGRKTLLKMMVMSIFSISQDDFNSGSYNHDFLHPCMWCLLNTLWEKEKMLVTSIFSFSHNVFYPSKNKVQFNFSVTCILSSANAFNFGPVQRFVVCWRVGKLGILWNRVPLEFQILWNLQKFQWVMNTLAHNPGV